jgi:hypothetical protein
VRVVVVHAYIVLVVSKKVLSGMTKDVIYKRIQGPCIHVIIYLENILSINGKYADIMEHIFDVPAAHYLYQIKQLQSHAVKIFLTTKLR